MNHIESTTERWQESVGEEIHACLLMQTTDLSICLPDGIDSWYFFGRDFFPVYISIISICALNIMLAAYLI